MAGTGDAQPPDGRPGRRWPPSPRRRVTAYTGLVARAAAARRRRAIGRREWVEQHGRRCGRCSTRCWSAPARDSGRCARRCRSASGLVVTHRGGRRARLPGPARARPVRARAARRGGGRAARRGCCSCCPTSARRSRPSRPRSEEFMTWVALHEVTHAVQFAGVPVAARPRRRPGARAAAQRRAADGPAAQAAAAQRGRDQADGRGAAPRRPDRDRHQPTPSARRSTACRR